MPIIVKTTTNEIPDEGRHHVRITQVKELGMIQTLEGPKEKLLVAMDTKQPDKQGNPRKLYKRFNKTIHAKSALRKFVRSVTGEEPGSEFDLENLLGREFDVLVEHNEREGKTYANVTAIIRPKATGQSQAA